MMPVRVRFDDVRRQRGVVLFIALIAMIVMSLAGVALIRAADTTGSVAGNIAFRQASIPAVNMAVEEAVNALYAPEPPIGDAENDDSAHRYYAKLQAGESASGVPAILGGTYAAMKAAYPFAVTTYRAGWTSTEVRSVIERVCSPASPALPLSAAQKLEYCDTLPPRVSAAKTSMKLTDPAPPPIPLYRVTVRVDLPGTNATTFAQTMLHNNRFSWRLMGGQ